LDNGAGKLDETAIAEQLADIGANLGGGADTDRASVALRTLSAKDKREPALAILKTVLHQPLFDAAIFEREKARTIAGLKEAMTRPDSIAGKAFWAAMYPNHPYGRQATPESVAALNRDDLAAFHARYYVAANASITLVGDLSRGEAEKIAESIAADLPKGTPATLPAAPELAAGNTIALAHPASQAHVYIGLPGIERGNPDFFPLLVGNYTLGGGGFVSRLMKEVRDQRGYAYSVYSYFAPMRHTGPFQIGLQTKRSQASDARRARRLPQGRPERRGTSRRQGQPDRQLPAAPGQQQEDSRQRRQHRLLRPAARLSRPVPGQGAGGDRRPGQGRVCPPRGAGQPGHGDGGSGLNSVRIVGGEYRRRVLKFPDSEGLRPTPDRVRETLFNWLGQDLDGWHCLDLFAGSGALGFEAASRGAARVVMVEQSPKVLAALHENHELLHKPSAIEIVRADALQYLASTKAKFDLIFLDPPYKKGWIARLEPFLPGILNEDAAIYVEAEHEIESLGNWRTVRQGKAGEVHFHLLRQQTS
jgi:16S rRNA (guanine(966)-N(2))-methyltransferase RsmD